jgi:hypothetical protein
VDEAEAGGVLRAQSVMSHINRERDVWIAFRIAHGPQTRTNSKHLESPRKKKNTKTKEETYIRNQIQPLHDLRVVVRPKDGADLRHGPRVPGVDVWASK